MEGVSTRGQGRRGAAARVLALLAVVLGLLGMHGLASTHHAAAAAPGHAASAVAADQSVSLEDRPAPQQHDHAASRAEAVSSIAGALLAEAVLRPAVPACEQDCPSSLTLLCAAVIAAAAATAWRLGPTARRRAPMTPAGGGPQARAPAGARWLLPGLDPVAELCVSRT